MSIVKYHVSAIVFCLLFSMSAFIQAQTVVTIGQLKYQLNGTEAYVSGYVGSPTDVVIPATIVSDGLIFKVTKINKSAFYDCTTITSVKAEGDNLAEIGYNDNTSWYYGAFRGCTSLVSISFPSVITINSYTFLNCSKLQDVYLGNSLTRIQGASFCNCTMLPTIIIPASC